LGRPGKDLIRLSSLQKESIDSICVFPKQIDGQSCKLARIKVTKTNGDNITFRSKRIVVLQKEN